jgi:hypothetical protein
MRSEVIVTRWVERRPRLGAVFGERRSGRAGPVRACPSQRLSPGADDNRRPYGRRARASSLMSLSRTATDWSCSVWIGRVWLRQGQSPALEARSPMGGALAARTAEDQGVTVRLGDIKEEARRGANLGGGSHPRRGTVAEADGHVLVRIAGHRRSPAGVMAPLSSSRPRRPSPEFGVEPRNTASARPAPSRWPPPSTRPLRHRQRTERGEHKQQQDEGAEEVVRHRVKYCHCHATRLGALPRTAAARRPRIDLEQREGETRSNSVARASPAR